MSTGAGRQALRTDYAPRSRILVSLSALVGLLIVCISPCAGLWLDTFEFAPTAPSKLLVALAGGLFVLVSQRNMTGLASILRFTGPIALVGIAIPIATALCVHVLLRRRAPPGTKSSGGGAGHVDE